jgi:hypothetical protein
MAFMKYILFCGLLLSLPIISARFISTKTSPNAPENKSSKSETSSKKPLSAEEYILIKDSVLTEKNKLTLKYKTAITETEKQQILAKAEKLFTNALLDNIIDAWYGTPWEFYGTTEIPNEGTIACGYFVTTVLRDAGVKLDRVHLAEIESETMIRTLIDKKYITRYRNIYWRDFLESVKKAGDGLYMIGLDYHTGFLLCKDGKVYFINSNIPGVMKENAESAYMLCVSNYRVTGRLTNNPEFIKKWLLDKDFPNLNQQK